MNLDYLYFWREHEQNGVFSQWYFEDMVIDGVTYNCCEQYMMAQKALLFNDLEIHSQIMQTTSPKVQQSLGKKVKDFNNGVWDNFKGSIVFRGNLAKFNGNLRNLLLSTGDKFLVEASPYDRVWGIGFKSDIALSKIDLWGQNLLGKILMEVRGIYAK